MRRQLGFGFLHILITAIIAVVALGVWQHQVKKSEMLAIQEQKAAEAERERQERLAAEKEALAQRLADEKRKDDFEKAAASIDSVYAKWLDAEKLAQSTARIALAQPVAALQQIKRDAEGMIVPPCLDAAKAHLVSGMNWTIDGFVQFMTDKKFAEFTAPPFFSSAKSEFEKFLSAKKACQ